MKKLYPARLLILFCQVWLKIFVKKWKSREDDRREESRWANLVMNELYFLIWHIWSIKISNDKIFPITILLISASFPKIDRLSIVDLSFIREYSFSLFIQTFGWFQSDFQFLWEVFLFDSLNVERLNGYKSARSRFAVRKARNNTLSLNFPASTERCFMGWKRRHRIFTKPPR